MPSPTYALFYHSNNPLMCDLLVNLLKENDIPYIVAQEAVGKDIFPIMVGKLSDIDIFVPQEHLNQAQAILDAYINNPSDEDSSEPE